MAKMQARWINFDPATLKNLSGALSVNINDAGVGSTDIWSASKIKAEIDAAIAGLDFQKDVIDVQVDATLDPGVTPTAGDRYIITDALNLNANFGTITGLENGDIVEYDGTAWVVAYDVSVMGSGVLTWVQTKSEYWRWDGTTWAYFGGLSGVTAGAGLTKTGNTLDVGQGNGIQVNADTIDVKADVTTGGDVAPVSVTINGVGVDVTALDGDHLTIDLIPANYTPDATVPEAADALDLAAHLKGIDNQLASLSATADTKKVKVSATDTTEDFLNAKVVPGIDSSINITVNNAGANETLDVQLVGDVLNPADNSVYSKTIAGKGWNSIDTLLQNTGNKTYTETITITATDITNGYIQLTYQITGDVSKIKITPIGGPMQYNKAWGTATADFQALATYTVNGQIEIANVRTTGLSGDLQAGDVIVVEYPTNLQLPV